jgi:hypothetical protein
MAAKSPPPTKSLAVAPGFAFPAAGSPVKVILGMRLPISPALALTSLTIDGKPAEGWRLKSGMLLAPGAGISTAKEQQLVAVVLAGWQSLPHVLHLAISLICHHWMDHPEDSQSRQLGESQHQVDQFLHMLTPVGGLRWL